MNRRLHFGRSKGYWFSGDIRGRVELYFDFHDWWIGVFFDSTAFYLIVIPTSVIRISRGRKP